MAKTLLGNLQVATRHAELLGKMRRRASKGAEAWLLRRSLFHQHSAVNLDSFANQVARRLGGEEEDRPRDLFRRPDAPQRNVVDEIADRFRGRELFVERRVNHAGRDGVDPYAMGRKLLGQPLGHRDHSAFGGRIMNRTERTTVAPSYRSDVDDRPALALDHRTRDGLRA